MLSRISNSEILTMSDAAKRYANKQICMVITERCVGHRVDRGYVVYVADNEGDFLRIPESEKQGKDFAWFAGDRAEPGVQIGGVVVK